jgi:Gluconate 2-dehydrogenase subunit 3
MSLDRRQAIALLAAGVIPIRLLKAQHELHQIAASPGNYVPQFFQPGEYALIDQVAEMIIPADDHSPGAQAVRVADYIDLVVANSSVQTQALWRTRLTAFQSVPNATNPEEFAMLAAKADDPSTPAEHFFADMRHMTLEGYYTSEIGLRHELGYQGGHVHGSFPGCEH